MEGFEFPLIRRVSDKLMADEIIGKTNEDAAEELGKFVNQLNKHMFVANFLIKILDDLKSKRTENKGGGIRPIDYQIDCLRTTIELVLKSNI